MQSGDGYVVQNTDTFVATAQKIRTMLSRYQLSDDSSKLQIIEGQLREVGDALNLNLQLDELTAKSEQITPLLILSSLWLQR